VLVAPESAAEKVAGPAPVETYSELQLQIHHDLRAQHPEWVQPNGDCPTCDYYEARLAELLDGYVRTGSEESILAVHRAMQEAASANQLPSV